MGLGIKKAFILAGGEGTRLRPITYEIAKPLLPVKGKPVLWWNIELCRLFGVKEIVLAVGYKHGQVEEHFGSGKKFGVKLHYNVEKEFLGTAGALKFAEAHFEGEEKFIMMNGDECKEIDFAALDGVFERNRAIAAIALTEIEYTAAGGLVALDGERITNFEEKPSGEKKGRKLINAGAYILSPKILEYIPAGKMVSIEKETFPRLVSEGKAFGLPCAKQFYQTDTFERYEKAIFGWRGFGK
jgi:NDP-sugar pyrophosphorylase family protein